MFQVDANTLVKKRQIHQDLANSGTFLVISGNYWEVKWICFHSFLDIKSYMEAGVKLERLNN